MRILTFIKFCFAENEEFKIISFEMDDRLAPYFASYGNHHLICPAAVTDKDGEIKTYAESPWSPNKQKNNGNDMQWGGGTIYAFKDETKNTDGGTRKLNYRLFNNLYRNHKCNIHLQSKC